MHYHLKSILEEHGFTGVQAGDHSLILETPTHVITIEPSDSGSDDYPALELFYWISEKKQSEPHKP